MNFLNSIQSKLHGAVNPNSVQYIKQQDLQVQLDPSGTAYVDHGNQAFSLNVDDENTTALAILDKAPSTQPLSLSGQSQFTICLKHKVQDATNPLIGQYYTNPQYDLSLSSTVVGTLDTVQVNVFNASDDPVSYSITGGLTSADLSNADLTGTVTNLYTPLSYTLRSGYGNFVFGLDGLSQQVTATVYQKYWIKSVTNLLGDLVFGFSSTGSGGDYLNQPDISFGAGGKYMFDITDPTMADLSLVFGTTVDDISTVNDSVVTRTSDLVIVDISAGYDGDRLVYFEDSSAGMGYVSSSGSGTSGTAPQLLNNSFESSSLVGSSDTYQIYYGNTNIDNWTTIGPNDNTNRTFIIRDNDTAGFNFPTPFVNGSYCMALGYQYHNGLIQTGYLQQIITLPVNNYILSWYDVLRTYPGVDSEPIRIKITKDEDSTVIHTHEYLVTNKAWTEKTTSFSITEEANYIVSFESYDYNNMYGQTAFDNVTFSIAPPTVENYTVDVGNSVFRLDSGDGNGFVEKLAVAFNSGTTYIFDQSDSTNIGNTLVIGSFDVSSSIVSSGLTIMGTPGQPGAYTKYVSDGSTVHYFSYQTENMGTASPPPNITDDLYVHYDFEFPLYDANGTAYSTNVTGGSDSYADQSIRFYNKAYDSSTNSDISYNMYVIKGSLVSDPFKVGSRSFKTFESGNYGASRIGDYSFRLNSTQGYSICFWMKEVEKNFTPSQFLPLCAFGNGSSGGGFFQMEYNDSTFKVNNDDINITYNISSLTITDWNHIAFTMSSDGSTWKLYINGSLVNTKTNGTLLTSTVSGYPTGTVWIFDISAKPGGGGNNGFIDDFRFYKTEISAAQVSAVYSYTG